MTTPTMHGAECDLLVIREVRDRILAGDWTQGTLRDDAGRRCLVNHLDTLDDSAVAYRVVAQAIRTQYHTLLVSYWNDTHTQAEVVALLDDVEDSLLGELGVVG